MHKPVSVNGGLAAVVPSTHPVSHIIATRCPPQFKLPPSAGVKTHIAQRVLLDHKSQDSEARLQFTVEKGDVKTVLDTLEDIPEKHALR